MGILFSSSRCTGRSSPFTRWDVVAPGLSAADQAMQWCTSRIFQLTRKCQQLWYVEDGFLLGDGHMGHAPCQLRNAFKSYSSVFVEVRYIDWNFNEASIAQPLFNFPPSPHASLKIEYAPKPIRWFFLTFFPAWPFSLEAYLVFFILLSK